MLFADAGSGDGSVELVRERYASVSVLELGSNLGFAAGHNRNFARARGEHFLALNPDVVLAPGFLSHLVAVLDRTPDAGAVTGRLLRPGPGRRLDSAGIRWALGRTRFLDRGVGEPACRFDEEEDVFGACGAAALYRRRALESVARPGETPFAERFFMYYEDVDLAWRLRRAGWRTRYAPGAEARHLRGGSGAGSAFVEYHLVRNRLWVSLRNASVPELLRELPGLALFQTVKATQALRRPHLRAALRDQWRGVRPSLRERGLAAAGGPD